MPNRPDRNHAIERLLREARPGTAVAADGPCVTAEELAAWLDKGLPEAESIKVEAHLAACPACQTLLAAYASTEPAVAASRTWPRAAIPFAAAAVLVIGVWVAGTRWGGQPVPDTAVERQMARLEAPSAAPVQPAERVEPEAPAARANQQSADLRDRDARADGPAATLKRRVAVRPEAIDQSAAQERPAVISPPPAELRPAEAPAAAAPAPPPAQAIANTRGDVEQDRARQQLEKTETAPQRARAEGFSTASARLASASAAKAADARVPISSPDGSWRWRIAGNALEVSADGGATWLPAIGVTPGDLANVTGGVSPGAGVSWLVGRGGLVLVTADGRRFTRAMPPAAATLTGVQAADASTADVQAADGRAWRTTNGGRAWAPIK